jgi:D-beta-D-heptose 7-phosphate kinase/D-beta-D-heptose 1-phosphate adenosyltransferase
MIVQRFSRRRLLVVGDVMLDRYWRGQVERISPEAPVPVVSNCRKEACPGGAGNTAANIASLGGTALLVGMVGTDPEAGELLDCLRNKTVDCSLMQVDSFRTTTVKTRVVAHNQQIVRVDSEDLTPMSAESADAAAQAVGSALSSASSPVDGIVISDYAKGFVTDRLIARVIAFARQAGKPVFVDPKACGISRYRGATFLKPNRKELSILTGYLASNPAETLTAGLKLAEMLPGTSLLITEGQDGMMLLIPGERPFRLPAEARQVYDVTGAGDTVLSIFAMSVASGADLRQAAWLANIGAGIIVGQVGTTALSRATLLGALEERLHGGSAYPAGGCETLEVARHAGPK